MRRHLWAAAQFGAGNAIYLLFSALWTFELPRQITVERFADWRLFVVYSSFVGALHGGALDALLYRWSRRRSAAVPPSLWSIVGVLAIWHVVLGALWALACWWFRVPHPLIGLVTAILAYALIWNVVTCLQYAMQAGRRFLPLSLFAALQGTFMGSLVLSGLFRPEHGPRAEWGFIGSAAFAGGVAFLPAAWVTGSWVAAGQLLRLLYRAVLAGFPILVVNLLLIALLNADRIAVSVGFSRVEFAMYAFAASLLAIANSLISVGARFAVPYVTRWVQGRLFEDRFGAVQSLLFGSWALLLGAFVVVRWIVLRYLPAYVPALRIAFIMALGAAFAGPIQILHLNYARAARRTWRSTAITVVAGILAVGAMAFCVATRSLALVAAGSVALFVTWWCLGSCFVLPVSPQMCLTHAWYFVAVAILGAGWLWLLQADGGSRAGAGIAGAVCVVAAAISLAWPWRAASKLA
ncbi:MAG: hypothetical protein AUG13_04210 [Chloroflexi bacterium 13_1_20CM_2_59_7]|nr:MAG: hypothetical protein AUG13_04210 [Chloroflexi bacterium 13_1_20CM_2_59_7]